LFLFLHLTRLTFLLQRQREILYFPTVAPVCLTSYPLVLPTSGVLLGAVLLAVPPPDHDPDGSREMRLGQLGYTWHSPRVPGRTPAGHRTPPTHTPFRETLPHTSQVFRLLPPTHFLSRYAALRCRTPFSPAVSGSLPPPVARIRTGGIALLCGVCVYSFSGKILASASFSCWAIISRLFLYPYLALNFFFFTLLTSLISSFKLVAEHPSRLR